MINNIFKDIHYMKLTDTLNSIKSNNIYYNYTLRLLIDLFAIIDFDKTAYKAYIKDDTIVFMLSDNLYIALSFSDDDYIVFVNFNDSSESIIYTKKLIDNVPVHFIDMTTNIKNKILEIKSFLYNTENQYIKSLKAAFMQTY